MRRIGMPTSASTRARSLINGAVTSALLLLSLTPGISRAQTPVAGGFVAGTRELFSLNLASAPPGQLPKGVSARDEKGNYGTTLPDSLSVVVKDGVPMLKALKPVDLLIELQEMLPDGFTIEFDLIPKYCCGEDISFEGTRDISRSDASMNVTWWRESIIAVGGGEYVQSEMPGDLKEIVGLAPTRLAASFQGTSFRLFTNGRNVLDLPNRQFVHGRVLRVTLSGQADGTEKPLYLSRLRIAATSPTVVAANSTNMTTLATGTPTEVVPTGVMPVSTSAPQPVAAPPNPSQVTGVQTAAPNSPASRAAPLPSSPTNPLPVVSASSPDGSVSMSSASSTSPNTQTEPHSSFAVTVTPSNSGPVVTWPVVSSATGYSVSRFKVDDGSCCNNNSGRGYTATPPWQDKPLPTSGTYGYLVLATTAAGLLRAETQFSYTAPTAVVASTTTSATGMVAGTVVGGTATQQMGTVVGTVGSSTTDVPAKYRVTLTGFRVTTPTREPIILDDGRFDEAYAAAAIVLFNRKDSTVASHTVVRTREYGDVGGGKFGDRIQAGTATSSGGLGGLGGEHVPAEFDPSGSTFPAATSDRFPLLVWEGALNTAAEALLVVPSVWDRDLDSTTYVAWKTPWITSSLMTFVRSNEVVNETKTAGVVQIVSDQHPGFPFVLPMSEAEGHVKDRPIGAQTDPPLPLPPVAIIYKDRHVMLTREKLADLAPGGSKMILVPFGEVTLTGPFGAAAALGALYTLYLRIERIQ